MSLEIRWLPPARRDLKQLDRTVQRRVVIQIAKKVCAERGKARVQNPWERRRPAGPLTPLFSS